MFVGSGNSSLAFLRRAVLVFLETSLCGVWENEGSWYLNPKDLIQVKRGMFKRWCVVHSVEENDDGLNKAKTKWEAEMKSSVWDDFKWCSEKWTGRSCMFEID